MWIGEDLREAGGQSLDDADVAGALIVGAQGECLTHDLVEIDHRARGVPLARERQQIPNDLRGALRLTENRVEAAPGGAVEIALGEPLGAREDRRERVVEFVGDTGDGLPERRELFGLKQLVIEIARLILETFALADVTHQRFDAKTLGCRLRPRGDLHPDWRAVGAPQPQQVVGHGSIALQALDEPVARLDVHEAIRRERADLLGRRLRGVPENQLEIGIRRQRFGDVGGDRPDVHALVDGLEQPGKGVSHNQIQESESRIQESECFLRGADSSRRLKTLEF